MLDADPDAGVTIDLAEQGMLLPDGSTYEFTMDPFARQMLLAGTDEVGWVIQRLPAIEAWEAAHPARVDTRPAGASAGAHAPSAA
jgi:3-isopropylmalate/(R)-2-methylmalate dehydratase small subunit